MKLLLDTHVLIWAARAPERLSERVRSHLQDRDNELLVSVAAAYEIELKRERNSDIAKSLHDRPDHRRGSDPGYQGPDDAGLWHSDALVT